MPLQSLMHSSRNYLPAILLGALFLLIPALYNGYPMVNPDTATYLASGFLLETPFDRPITYGLLIRLLSLNGFSLWLVVFAQAVIVSGLVVAVVRHATGGRPHLLPAVVVLLLLSVGSGLSWVVCQVGPDVFTPVAFLTMLLVLLYKGGKGGRVGLYFLFFVAVAVHMSHPVLMAGTLVLLYLCSSLFATVAQPKVKTTIVVLFVLSVSAVGIMGSALSKSRHVFLMGSLVEKGIARQYLNDQCGTHTYRLCAYRDQLPDNASDFIWLPGSPLYKAGDWAGTKTEFNAITHDIFTTPKYLLLFGRAAVWATLRQLVLFRVGDGNEAFAPQAVLTGRIGTYLPGSEASFLVSRQNRGTLLAAFTVPNIIFNVTAIVSLIMLVIMTIGRKIALPVRFILFVFGIGILFNAADCAVMSCVLGRYGCRMMWLLPFCTLLVYLARRGGSELPSTGEHIGDVHSADR